ncbi:rRNA-processing protein utp21 [Exophiala sideris]|uniref:rRNA-processing protein utp21 n=1 Tax=Exophiala sideris TaxID=1016849 RepID=A0ABR0IY75_9EURO|nr:rRNA-processing protein utp21 [Exophiala sideris]KAK5027222.1 rRNA-processing protein utp21 [Exophiala sideris]KAK5051274.1 rRNA-processing protein utp21 [Exophiala sideris]KAK5177762.1 rRNA-processing protein utp21 [Eurotiomycetes sp. CCFEE 6388]
MDDVVEFPVAKRQRRENDDNVIQQPPTSSRLFSPFRTLGLVSPTNVPFTSVPLGKKTFQITTSVGNALQTYDLRRGLNLVFLSRPQCPGQINATYAYRDRVLVAWAGSQPNSSRGLWVFKRGQLIAELDTNDTHSQEIGQILVFGSWIVGCGSEAIEVWKTDSYEHYTTIRPSTPSTSNHARAIFSGQICTLPTILNKIFVGRKDGIVEVYNVSTGRLVHTILAPSARSGPVTALAPAPALCLLAVAYADGSLVITDVESDELVLELHQRNTKKPITSISFRTDGMGASEDGRKSGVMATSSIESGDITLWDLNRGGRVIGVVRGAHETSSLGQATGVNKIEFLPGQPVLISTGLDNALRSWVFDENPFSPTPRPLHSRSGHAASIMKLKFLPAASDGSDASGKWLLSAGRDRSLWGFSLRKDGQSTELSQGAVTSKARKQGLLNDDAAGVEDFKAAPIIDMACSLNRDGGMGAVGGRVWANSKDAKAEETSTTGWESIVTAHADDKFARTWSWGRRKAGRWTFETGDHKPVTSVAITTCGTFAIVGSAGGSLDMFNLQSGVHRQRYPPWITSSQAKQLKLQQAQEQRVTIPQGHRDAITGIVVDNLNQTMVSTSLDGTIIFWDFSTGRMIERRKDLEATVTAIRYNAVSGLLALSCDDLCIRILDIETRKVVRELWGCVGQIYDFCFSHDGRWIVACSMDSVVRVFDLATGHLIDAFRTATCTSIAFSNTGEFLATTHAGSAGINIWTNKALFTRISTRQIDEVSGVIDLTENATFQAASQLAITDSGAEEDEQVNGIDSTMDIEQLDQSLLTLSIVPQSRWQTLLNLDSIRERNKPIQPPEKPKVAPFFLGSALTNGTKDHAGNMTAVNDQMIENTEQSRITRMALTTQTGSNSRLSDVLDTFDTDLHHNPSPLSEHLTSLPPSAADLEIRSLTLTEMPVFVRALTEQVKSRKSFELVNTWMSVFLKLHGDFVADVDGLNQAVLGWRTAMENEEKRLGQLVGYTRGIVEFLRSAR